MKILDYSVNAQHSIERYEHNYSDVFDRLIRITAKITERFASDILYDIEWVKAQMDSEKPFNLLLGFHEDGVNSYTGKEEILRSSMLSECAQVWLLSYEPIGDKPLKLKRVRVLT